MLRVVFTFLFFFNDTATTEIYTLSLHDALPIYLLYVPGGNAAPDLYDDDRPGINLYTNSLIDAGAVVIVERSEEHTSELQSPDHLVCRLLLEKKKKLRYNRVATLPLEQSSSRCS